MPFHVTPLSDLAVIAVDLFDPDRCLQCAFGCFITTNNDSN